jgi:hypothetical protein
VQVELKHLTRFGEPLRAVALDPQTETILFLHRDECRPRHQMFVNRPERSATIDPNFGRSKPVSQNGERGNLVQKTIRFSLIEDESLIGLAEVG